MWLCAAPDLDQEYDPLDTDDGSSSDGEQGMDIDDLEDTRQGERTLTAEDRVFQAVAGLLLNAHVEAAEERLHKKGPMAARLLQHVNTLFQGNTEEGTRTKFGDWVLFCDIVHPGPTPEVQEVIWPPSCESWKMYLMEARQRTHSYKRFQGMVGNVCEVAVRYWYKQKGLSQGEVDPRVQYRPEHYRVMHALKRELGLGVTQIAPITMHEARNGTHFADVDSVRGVAACAAFCVGVLLGGRRPRTLTAIRLEDLGFYTDTVLLHGREVVVPCLRVRFREEKFDDKQGPREATDEPHYSGDGCSYADEIWMSCAYWVYRLLVLRGCFEVFDPILGAKEGDQMHVRSDCMAYYLFCEVQPNYWIDTMPASVGTIGSWNKHLLRALGTQPRGFSAHRSGFVSRSCILAILASKGTELPLGTLEMITRWGGWQVITGTKTVMETYARKIVDQFLDPYGMINGCLASDEHWARKKRRYLGHSVFPPQPVIDCGRTQQPLQVRVMTWRGLQWAQFQQQLNELCRLIMSGAQADDSIMPVNRYVQGRRAFNLYLVRHAGSPVVLCYKRLISIRVNFWRV